MLYKKNDSFSVVFLVVQPKRVGTNPFNGVSGNSVCAMSCELNSKPSKMFARHFFSIPRPTSRIFFLFTEK